MNKKTLMLYYPYGVRVVAGPYYKESFIKSLSGL